VGDEAAPEGRNGTRAARAFPPREAVFVYDPPEKGVAPEGSGGQGGFGGQFY
jgi:hypothetical protein